MPFKALLAGTIVAGVFVAAGSASGTLSYQLAATMTAKQVVKPQPTGDVGKARGSLSGKTTIVGKRSQVKWTLTFSGMTGKVKTARVRYPARGVLNAIQLCAPCKSGTTLLTTFPSKAVGQVFLERALAGKVDIVLTTRRNPRGEVRGVVKALAS